MIFTRKTKQTENGTQYEVRTLGRNFWIDEKEFKHHMNAGNLFYKANHPVTSVPKTAQNIKAITKIGVIFNSYLLFLNAVLTKNKGKY